MDKNKFDKAAKIMADIRIAELRLDALKEHPVTGNTSLILANDRVRLELMLPQSGIKAIIDNYEQGLKDQIASLQQEFNDL